ncbi:Uncharacterized protein HZ326_16304 [Fusarium oxysporum f. sp. albedinis]|nr:Uncharacterized protein HZ326_16304 [Fusarium oxysporum f. sp. albedinis]
MSYIYTDGVFVLVHVWQLHEVSKDDDSLELEQVPGWGWEKVVQWEAYRKTSFGQCSVVDTADRSAVEPDGVVGQ